MRYIISVIFCLHLILGRETSEATIGYFMPSPIENATIIGMENGFSFDTKIGEPVIPQNLRAKDSPDYPYYLIQFTGPIYTEWKEKLQTIGIKIYAYWPNYAYLVKADHEQLNAIKSLPYVHWIGLFHPAYKINIDLLNARGTGIISIQLYPDADLNKTLEDIAKTGAKILDFSVSEIGKLVRAEYDLSLVYKIAQIPEVLAIVPWTPDELMNENSQWVCQTGWKSSVPPDTVGRRVWHKGIRGQNMILGFSDSGITTTHIAYSHTGIPISDSGHFASHRKIVAYLLLSGAAFGDVGSTYHGSHVGGTIAGDDSINGGTNVNDGIAYKSRLFFVDIANASGSLVTPTDLTPLYNMFYNDPLFPMRQHSASWGRTGTGYIDRDAFSDAYHWQHKDFLDIFAAGNNGPTYRTITHAAYAKNVVAVGALQNGTSSNQIASFSSRGPTLDLRVKPTVCTPGQNIVSVDGGTTSNYKTLSGTSMATPACNASAGLIRQYLKQGWYPSGSPNPNDTLGYISAALIRAMLIVSADPNVGTYIVPDSNIGFGRVDIDSVLYFAGDTRRLAFWDDTSGLTTGQYKEYYINVYDSTLALRCALVWTDTAAAVGSNPNIVNDLNLQMTNPYGTYYRGNQMSNGQSVTNPANYDNRNVEEVCRINTPRRGIWTIRVSAQNISYPKQPYALVVTGGMNIEVGIEEKAMPRFDTKTTLARIIPNPASSKVMIQFQISQKTEIALKVFDVSGRLMSTILKGQRESGIYDVEWKIGESIPSGVYFVMLEAENTKQIERLIIVR
ncbi:MAG: S8 family serine peptidase [candidate division WOR-3 bacterium]